MLLLDSVAKPSVPTKHSRLRFVCCAMEMKNCWSCHRVVRDYTYSIPVAIQPASISRNQKPVFPSTFATDRTFDVGAVISKATRTTTDVTEREVAQMCKHWHKRDGEILYDSNERFMSTLVPKRMRTFGVFDTLICARAFAKTFGVVFADTFRLDLLDEYWGDNKVEDEHAMWEDGVEFGGDREDWQPQTQRAPNGSMPIIITDSVVPLHHYQTDPQ
jgi:hypothetical protein